MMPSGTPPIDKRSMVPDWRRSIGSIVSGIDVGESAGCGIVLGDKCRGESTAILAIAASVTIHAAYQLGQRAER